MLGEYLKLIAFFARTTFLFFPVFQIEETGSGASSLFPRFFSDKMPNDKARSLKGALENKKWKTIEQGLEELGFTDKEIEDFIVRVTTSAPVWGSGSSFVLLRKIPQ